ncbi:MAG: SoxR reducing system RseC family protein [Bacteroidales bacterium]|nr:SoxR reducing system RseC family protein [Bacteroidales bacterium]
MSRNPYIAHEATVMETAPGYVVVGMQRSSACDACHAKGLCGSGESSFRQLKVPCRGNDFKVGEKVALGMRSSLATRALMIAYLIPLAILLILLLSLHNLLSELAVGLIALGGLALYAALMAVFSKRINRQFVFSVHKL